MSKFTPGPWRHSSKSNIGNMVEAYAGRKSYPGDDGYRAIATAQSCGNFSSLEAEDENQAANIRLISASPDMLSLLKQTIAFLDDAIIQGAPIESDFPGGATAQARELSDKIAELVEKVGG